MDVQAVYAVLVRALVLMINNKASSVRELRLVIHEEVQGLFRSNLTSKDHLRLIGRTSKPLGHSISHVFVEESGRTTYLHQVLSRPSRAPRGGGSSGALLHSCLMGLCSLQLSWISLA